MLILHDQKLHYQFLYQLIGQYLIFLSIFNKKKLLINTKYVFTNKS